MPSLSRRAKIAVAGLLLAGAAGSAPALLWAPDRGAHASDPAAQAPHATPVSVATVEQRNVALWDEFSGRLEAVERVDVRSRVAGAVKAVHFREGALVKQGDLLITIDPDPFAAEVDRAEAQVVAAQARVALTKVELERGRQLLQTRNISQRDVDVRLNAEREAEANLRAAQAALRSARLNLSYTEIRAPISGRVGKLEITVGNLVDAGPEGPVLTTLVSVQPIYASFHAEESVVLRALEALGAGAASKVERIPVQMTTVTNNGTPYQGRLQLIDNRVDPKTGTVRVRAVFDNKDGSLIPGQFVRLRMGRANSTPALLVNERAVGTDQDKKFVLVVDGDNKAQYREVELGASLNGLRVVTNGLQPGERIVVNGLQRIRPGALVAPQYVRMDGTPVEHAQATSDTVAAAQR